MEEIITISRTEYEGLKREIAELRSLIKELENTIALMKERVFQSFKDCLGLFLLEGSLDILLSTLSQKAKPVYETIRARIVQSEVVGTDETGCRVNGKKHWFHVWQTNLLTFIAPFINHSVIRLFSYSMIQLFVICLIPVRAQWIPSTLLTSPVITEADSNKLTLGTDITGFFKNNEYFSPVAVGQTLPGVSMLLAAGYQVSGKFRAEAGMYALKYSGEDNLSNEQAFVRMQYDFTPNFHMVVGNLYGGVNHRLIEPLYMWERHFTDKQESGLQFVLNNDRWFTDAWINWQHFIRRGSAVPEMLTFGTSVSYHVFKPSREFGLSIPLQLLIHHTGGQIDTSSDPMIVLGNVATGICSKWNINSFWLRSVGLDIYLAGYYDRYANTSLRPYTYSLGIYPILRIDAKPLEIMAGYWQTEKFYSFEGEPLFGSFDPFNSQNRLPDRKLLAIKLAYNRKLLKGVMVGTQIELYTDLLRNTTDYSFGVHLRFNDWFLLKK